jgi:hypothetical protein
LKNIEFQLKPQKGLPLVLPKNVCSRQKMSQKSIFQPREARILSQLDILCCTYIFKGFEKYRVFAQNPDGLAFGFTNKHLFAMKMG